MPLGFERLKICELFAELLHCSNMSNLNAVQEERSPPLDQDERQHSSATSNSNDDENKMDKTIPENLQAELDEESPVTMATTETTGPTPSTTNHPSDEKTQETTVPASDTTTTSTEPSPQDLPMGDYLKLQLVQHKVLPTCTVSLY
jgi:hypothetical protein